VDGTVESSVTARSRWSLGGRSPVTVGDLMEPAVVVRQTPRCAKSRGGAPGAAGAGWACRLS